jgi:hypothetical protein
LLRVLLEMLLRKEEREALEALRSEPLRPSPLPPVGRDKVAATEDSATSPPCESTIVVMQAFSGSGGSRTRVMIPGTTSEKCRETNVEIKEDFPTPSVEKI